MDDEIFLSGHFQQYPECKKSYTVRLGRRNLIYEERQDATTYTKLSKGFTSVLLKDVVCAKLYESKLVDDIAAYFQIISYPMGSSGKKKSPSKRKRSVLTFRVNDSDDSEENKLVAETWARTFEWLIATPDLKPNDLQDLEDFPSKKRILVLVNPKSGNGSSLAKFRKFAEPLFKDAGLFYKEIVTKSANHGVEIAYDLELEEWDGIAVCSGDGLAYEVIQGFMQRDDWENAIKMPIGMIPTGSGNALCAAVLYAQNDVFDILSAAFTIARGKSFPVDLCSIQNNKHRMFAFLSLTWGIISDIDIESERFRLLGNARFTAGAVYRILALRTYGGRISYLPIDEGERSEAENAADSSVDARASEQTKASSAHSFSHTRLHSDEKPTVVDRANGAGGTEHHVAEGSRQNAYKAFDRTSSDSVKKKDAQNQSTRRRHFSLPSGMFKRSSSASKYGTIEENNEHVPFGDDGAPREEIAVVNSNARERRALSTADLDISKLSKNGQKVILNHPKRPLQGPDDTLLPRLDEPLPEGWVTSDGEFVTVFIMLISHLGSSLLACPDLKLGDGTMELFFAKKGTSRKAMLDVLSKMETGEHVGVKDLKIHKIKAFRLELGFEKEGYLAVDGEAIDYGNVQGQVHKGMGRVFLCS